MIGSLLNDRYRLDAEIGQGGMGTVYRGHDTLLQRDVAVKVLSSAALGTEGRARMLHEALKLDPGHAVIRRALADTLPRTGIAWSQARELLRVPWPEHMCVDDVSFPPRDSAAAFRRLAGFEQAEHDRWVEDTRKAADRCRFGYRWWHW